VWCRQAALEANVASLAAQEAAGSPLAALELEVLLTEASLADALAQHESWTSFLFLMLAKYKDGQRLDDLRAETLSPTKLFYPEWWLTAVGYYTNGGTPPPDLLPQGLPKEGESAPVAFSGFGALASHCAAAAAAVAATYAYLGARGKLAASHPSNGGASGFGVELPSLARATTRRTYQQIV
jgi:hypothetical protein